VDTLLKYGYKGQYMSENWLKQPLFIQSFAPTSIVHVSDFIDSPKVFLIDDISVRTQDTNQVLMFCNYLSPICSNAMKEKQSG
jgi:glycerophosphoryl diester phosphodiesterase